MEEDWGISARARRLGQVTMSYIPAALKANERPWSEQDPSGFIQAAIAENKSPELCTRILNHFRDSMPIPPGMLGYTDMRGMPSLRMAVATHLQRTLAAAAGPSAAPLSIDHDHLLVTAGAAAALEGLFYCFGEPGDAVLVPAPFYPAFVGDLEGKPGLKVIPVHNKDRRSLVPTPEALTDAAAAAEGAGLRVVALLLTNPVNPTGVVLSPGTVQGLVRWALTRRIHVVSDEIYYASIWGGGGAEGEESAFETAMRSAAVVSTQLGMPEAARKALVHCVFGMSKDYCASGLRVGFVWTQNEALLRCFGDSLSLFCAVSNETQHHLKDLLTDTAFVDSFLADSRAALRAGYEASARALTAAGVPFTPASAGMFVWLDLRQLLPQEQAAFADERNLWQAMIDTEGVRLVLTPGEACCCSEPGFFRLCFASVPMGALEALTERLRTLKRAVLEGPRRRRSSGAQAAAPASPADEGAASAAAQEEGQPSPGGGRLPGAGPSGGRPPVLPTGQPRRASVDAGRRVSIDVAPAGSGATSGKHRVSGDSGPRRLPAAAAEGARRGSTDGGRRASMDAGAGKGSPPPGGAAVTAAGAGAAAVMARRASVDLARGSPPPAAGGGTPKK